MAVHSCVVVWRVNDLIFLPLWHGIGYDDVYEQNPSLADLHAETITTENIRSVSADIYRVVKKDNDASRWGDEDEDGKPPSFTNIEIRFQGQFNPEIGKEVTIQSWRNHGAP